MSTRPAEREIRRVKRVHEIRVKLSPRLYEQLMFIVEQLDRQGNPDAKDGASGVIRVMIRLRYHNLLRYMEKKEKEALR